MSIEYDEQNMRVHVYPSMLSMSTSRHVMLAPANVTPCCFKRVTLVLLTSHLPGGVVVEQVTLVLLTSHLPGGVVVERVTRALQHASSLYEGVFGAEQCAW